MNPHVMKTLRRALSVKRMHGSVEEGAFLLSLLPPGLGDRCRIDGAGNMHIDLRVKKRRGEYVTKTLFIAHTDTVHRSVGANVFTEKGHIWHASGSSVLGADDGAGVAILSGLINAMKPGYYVFARGEECGGIGSLYMAEEEGWLLKQFDRAIAFDRKNTFSVITHQFGGRCCSDVFALELANEFNERGLLYMPDDTGMFTDTAHFTDLIGECTNVSAGYYDEHTPNESLDIDHLSALFDAALAMDWEALTTARVPGECDPELMPSIKAIAGVAGVAKKHIATWDDPDLDNDPFYYDDNPGDIRRRIRKDGWWT